MTSDSPRLIVEVAFNTGASTGSSWHIGDPSRGIIGRFTIGESDVFTDITSYVRRIELTSGASSRVTSPLVEYEAGTATLLLDNSGRAFDPTNVDGPFFAGDTTVVIPVPGTLPNADPADDVVTEALDAQVSTSSAGATNASAGIAAVTVTSRQPTITPAGQTRPTGILFGSTAGGGGQANMNQTISQVSPAVIRTYETLPTAYGNTGMAQYVPSGTPQYISFKPSIPTLADSTAAGYDTIIKNLKAVIRGLPNIPGHRVIIHHEPIAETEGASPAFTVDQWIQAQLNTRTDVIDVVNGDATRTNEIWFTACTEGFRPDSTQATFFTKEVCAVLNEINWDCYGFDTATPPDDQIIRLHAFAKARGMRWSVGELGYSTHSVSTDAQMKSAMVATMENLTGTVNPVVAGWPKSEWPAGMTWFNQGRNDLAGATNSIAYWKDVCVNSSVAAT